MDKVTSFPFVAEDYNTKTMQVRQIVDGQVVDLTQPIPTTTMDEKVAVWKKHSELMDSMARGTIMVVQDAPGSATLTLGGVPFATINVTTRLNPSFGSVQIDGSLSGIHLAIPDENGDLGFDAQGVTQVNISSSGAHKVDATD